VVNLSLGHHMGAHDGTDAEERLHAKLAGPGKIFVVSAGNEQNDRIHIGGTFQPDVPTSATFDLLRPEHDLPHAVLTLWHSAAARFEVSLVTPSGQVLAVPQQGQTYRSSHLQIDLGSQAYAWSNAVQIQIGVQYTNPAIRSRDLRDWRVQITCRGNAPARLDGWFHNSGFASFHPGPLVDPERTVGLPATGEACLAVGSHVTRADWTSGIGANRDVAARVGEVSPFSSLGPTRDDRRKPDISAPGQYVTAALADHSEFASWDQRAWDAQRMLTIEGTSMAAPVVTGVVALLLQKKPTLDLAQVQGILASTARANGGAVAWSPAYGHGKVDVAAALAKL
jgi:subtilisin family serine protease